MTLRLTTGLRNAMLDNASFKSIMGSGVLEIYSGSQPSSAANAASGSKLVTITQSGLTFSSASPSTCLNFASVAASGQINKSSGETWKGTASQAGTAAWFRFYSNNHTTGASASAQRFDGACGVGTGELQMSSTSIASGATITIDTFQVALPAS